MHYVFIPQMCVFFYFLLVSSIFSFFGLRLAPHRGLQCDRLKRGVCWGVWEHLRNSGVAPRSSRWLPPPRSRSELLSRPRSSAPLRPRDGRGHRGLHGKLSEIIALLPFCAVRGDGVKLSVEAGCERGWAVVFGPLQPTSSNF